ncbi:MAG: sensor domain-containing diguanylate cyclase [Elusimicrobia bacterium]|nr:sensor domain-containing diguanylate cyclase [Elusimicrobiota bacterium]
MYIFSGSVFGGVLLAFAISAGIFTIATTGTINKFLLVIEILWIILVFSRIEKYRQLWISEKIKLKVEHEVLDRDLTLIQSSITANENKIDAINQRMQIFQSFDQMINSIENTMNEKELIKLLESLTQKFTSKGKWSIKRHSSKDIFVNYSKFNKVPLLITNTEEDRRFTETDYKNISSLIVVPIEIENNYWGAIKGYCTDKKEAFDDYDLRLLSILASLIGLILNNAMMFKKVESLAITDGLTGLYTRTYFIERLQEEIERSKTDSTPISVAIMDIDYFKKVNDTYGHLAGDTFLKQLSNILRRRFRSVDVLSRYGGEEFAVLMYHTTITESYKILEEVRKMIEEEKFFMPIESYHPIKIKKTISIGVVELKEEQTPDEIIKKADDALYKAKESGRNKVCVYKE